MQVTADKRPPTTKPPRKWPKRLIAVFTLIAAIMITIYFITPSIARYFVVQQLEKQGMADVSVGQIYWKPWIPSLELHNIHWLTPKREKVKLSQAQVAADWRAIADKHIVVTNLLVDGLELPIEVSPELAIGGISLTGDQTQEPAQPPSEPTNSPWQMSLRKLVITNTAFDLKGLPVPGQFLQQKTHRFEINSLAIHDFSTLSPQEKSNITFKGQFDDLAFEIGGNGAPLSNTLPVDARIKLLPLDPFNSLNNFAAPGLLEGIAGNGELKFELAIDHQSTSTGRKIDVNLVLATPLLETSLTKGVAKPVDIKLQSLDLDATVHLNLDAATFNVSMNSKLDIKSLAVSSNNVDAQIQNLVSDVQLLETEGQLTAIEQIALNIAGRLELESAQVKTTTVMPVLAFSDVSTQGTLKDKTIDVPQIMIKNIQVLGEELPLMTKLHIEKTVFGKNTLGERALTIDLVSIHDFNTALTLTSQNKLSLEAKIKEVSEQLLAIAPQPKSSDSNAPDTAKTELEAKAPQPKPPEWLIGEVKFIGDSNIAFFDNRTGYGVKHGLHIDTAHFKNLGLTQPTIVDFKSTLKSGGSVSAQGQITLADIQANTDLKAKIKNVDLPPLSPYVIPVIGYSIETGLLDTDINIKAKAGEGISNVAIEAHRVDLNPADERIIASLSKELTMPLDMSLSLIKNKKGTIKLDIPLNMDKTGLNADIAPVIRQSITRATKNASVAYLKYALQPYGSLLLLAEQSQKLMDTMQLVNIPFEKMSATLEGEQLGPATKIAELLVSKPDMQVRLCPVASKAEATEWPKEKEADLDKALETLALQRAQSVKQFFITQDINEKRLFVCAPKVIEKGPGEVKVSL